MFLQAIDGYVDEYNAAHPKDKMTFTWKQASDNSLLVSFLPNIILIALLVVFWVYIMRKMQNGFGDAGRQVPMRKRKSCARS